MVQRAEEDAGPEPQLLGPRSDRGEQHERRRRILRLGRERVVADEAAFEAGRLDVPGELVGLAERIALAVVLVPGERQVEGDRHWQCMPEWLDGHAPQSPSMRRTLS